MFHTSDWLYSGVPVADSLLDTSCEVGFTDCTTPKMIIQYYPSIGVLVAQDPTMEIVDKLVQIAEKMEAVVRGYEGEFLTNGKQLFDDRQFEKPMKTRPFISNENVKTILLAIFFLGGIMFARFISGGGHVASDVAGGFGGMAILFLISYYLSMPSNTKAAE